RAGWHGRETVHNAGPAIAEVMYRAFTSDGGASRNQPTGVLSRLRTSTSSAVKVATDRVLPSRPRNSTSSPSGGSNSTTVPTSPTSTSASAGEWSTATISNSLGWRDFVIGVPAHGVTA